MRYDSGAWRCENPFCNEPLTPDHVTLITTGHVRRFCEVECLIESHHHAIDVWAGYTTHGVRGPSTPGKGNPTLQAEIYHAFYEASSDPINGWFVYDYTYDDEQLGWTPLEKFAPPADYQGPYGEKDHRFHLSPHEVEELKAVLLRCGWEGDGELCAMMVPPFFSGDDESTCWFPIFHVKQSNNGFSYIASQHPLNTLGLVGHRDFWAKLNGTYAKSWAAAASQGGSRER
jgi:hypothetical protein